MNLESDEYAADICVNRIGEPIYGDEDYFTWNDGQNAKELSEWMNSRR